MRFCSSRHLKAWQGVGQPKEDVWGQTDTHWDTKCRSHCWQMPSDPPVFSQSLHFRFNQAFHIAQTYLGKGAAEMHKEPPWERFRTKLMGECFSICERLCWTDIGYWKLPSPFWSWAEVTNSMSCRFRLAPHLCNANSRSQRRAQPQGHLGRK